MERHEAIVCGAGAAGLGAAAALRCRGVEAVVLEQADAVAASWRARYDELRLNTLGWLSSPPGMRAWRFRYGRYPTRDRWIEFLERYAADNGIEARHGVRVERVERADRSWRVETSAGSLAAPLVVVATGWDREPHIPEWPGRDSFAGELLHAAQYRSAARFRGRDVLVAGGGNTGSEIAFCVSDGGAARVRVAVRTPPSVVPRDLLRFPLNYLAIVGEKVPATLADGIWRRVQRLIYGDLGRYGLAQPALGLFSTMAQRNVSPVVDGGFIREVKRRRIELVAALDAFDGPDVVLANGSRIRPDVVIAATGYRRGLDALVGHLGVLAPDGAPLVTGAAEHPAAPGLHFVGFTPRLSGQLRHARLEARALGRAVAA
jgi:cation diffusion facilitator CzcD-associated flavoprotein CzcO